MRRSLLLTALLACASLVQAISVELYTNQYDFCWDGVGVMQASVSGGQAPYQYAWYRVEGIDLIPICSECGPVQNGLIGDALYTVIVTDNVGATAEASDYLSVDQLSIQPSDIQIFPYIAGEQPYLKLYVGNTMPPNGAAMAFVSGSQLMAEPISPGNGVGIWWFRLLGAPGSMGTIDISYTYPGGQCAVGTVYTVPPPTVLPTLAVIDAQGSCANAPTGSITVALYDGTLHNAQPLAAMLGTQSFWYPGAVWTGQNATATTTTITVNNLRAGSNTFWLTGNNTLDSTPADMGFPYGCHVSIPYTIANLGSGCGRVQGRVFVDNNLNCTWQNGEPGLTGNILEIQPGPLYATVGTGGNYDVVLSPGAYTIEEQIAMVEEHCVNAPIPFTIVGGATPVTVNHACESVVPLDVAAMLSSGAARPGFQYQVSVLLRNHTPDLSGALTLTLQFDLLLGFLSANTAPNTVGSGTLTWNLPQLTAFQQRTIQMYFQVPPDVALLGQSLIATANVSTANPDGEPGNNTSTMVRIITGAYDPNDKLATTSLGGTSSWIIGEDEWIDYTIRFQNTGTDTAFHVIITDTLPSTLDPSTLEIGAASHPFTWELRGAGTLKFRFLNIQLPDSNVNEPRSHGFVGFRIRPRLPLLPGDAITNIANIYFDFNPPVITEPSVLTVPLLGVMVAPRVLLDGPYVQTTQRMNDGLRSAGLLPLIEPYTALGYGHVGGGGESVSPAVLAVTGDNAIVDWVLVELRSATAPYAVLTTRSALLQRDGDVVATNGIGPVTFSQAAGNYRIAIRHRNHLGAMTDAAVALNTSTATLVDLSATATGTFGTNARKAVGTRMVLWSGDSNFNGVVRYTGSTNDRDLVLVAVGGTVPTNVLSNVYAGVDIDMDGTVRYTGTANDRDIILMTIGGVTPTAVLLEQLP